MATAASRGWGNAPTPRNKVVTLRRSGGLALPVHVDVAEMVARLVDKTVARGYAVRSNDTWGYAPRKIRGSKTAWSNHAWGLAVDINATTNPMTENGKVITDIPSWVPKLWESYGWEWGGSWPTKRKDPMHFEFLGSTADAARQTALIKAPRPSMRVGAVGDDVKTLQTRLNAHGAKMKVDGLFGPKTNDIVRWFQGSNALVTDGIVGPITWSYIG